MINVSIAESVSVVGAEVNEKDSLSIELKQGKSVDLFEAMSSGASMDENTQKIMLFPVDNKWYGKEATSDEMVNKFRQLTQKLSHLLSEQYPSSNNGLAEIKWSMWEGTGIASADDIKSKITQESVIAKISLNIYNQFVEEVKKSNSSKQSRIRFIRQSAAKHYATLPEFLFFKKGGGEYTVNFVESMEVSKEQSKLAYTKQELTKGLDNPNPVVADSMSPSGDSDLPFSL